MRRRPEFLLLPLLLWGCRDQPTEPLVAAPDAATTIADAARGDGTPGFYFLTPIAPTLASYPGTFDGTLAPVVEVCRWVGSACEGAPLARYTLTEGTGSTLLRVVASAEHYRVDWPLTSLAAGQIYRIRVLLDDRELGFADARLVGAGLTAPQLVAQGIIPLGNSSRLAIRFRLEEGVGEQEPEPTGRQAELAAVAEQVGALSSQGLSREAFNAALASWIAGRPAFEAAGVDEASGGVWGRFTDGRLLIIPNNWVSAAAARAPLAAALPAPPAPGAILGRHANLVPDFTRSLDFEGAGGAADRARLGPTALRFAAGPAQASVTGEIARSSQVRLLVGIPQRTLPNGDQAQLDAFHSVTAGIGQMLGTVGYSPLPGDDASVEALRGVQGDGVFFFFTHGAGGAARGGEELYAAQTTSAVVFGVDDTDVLYADELDNLRLVYMLTDNGIRTPEGQPVVEFFYGITSRFVTEYMEFDETLVILNACGSAGATAASLGAAMLAQGAAAYFGWTGDAITPANSMFTVIRLLDRLIGANLEDPFREDPAQRPFDWPAVLAWMQATGLSVDGATQAELVATAGGASPPTTLLTPTVMVVNVAEDRDEIFLTGLFGSNPCSPGLPPCPDGDVTIDGVSLNVRIWGPEFILADLPRSGAGAAGDVLVTVREHPSNPRRLVAWSGPFTYTHNDMGSLSFSVTLNLNGRGDPGPIRIQPGDAPESVVSPIFDPARTATGTFTASGSFSVPLGECTLTESWTGSGSIQPELYEENVEAGVFTHFADFDYVARTAQLHTRFAVPVTIRHTSSGGECPPPTELLVLQPEALQAYDATRFGGLGLLNTALTDGMSIVAGSRSRSVPTRNHIGPGTATALINWGSIGASPQYEEADLEF